MKHYHPWFSDTLIPRQFGKLAESFGCGLDGITRIRLRSIWRASKIARLACPFTVRLKYRFMPSRGKAANKLWITQDDDAREN